MNNLTIKIELFSEIQEWMLGADVQVDTHSFINSKIYLSTNSSSMNSVGLTQPNANVTENNFKKSNSVLILNSYDNDTHGGKNKTFFALITRLNDLKYNSNGEMEFYVYVENYSTEDNIYYRANINFGNENEANPFTVISNPRYVVSEAVEANVNVNASLLVYKISSSNQEIILEANKLKIEIELFTTPDLMIFGVKRQLSPPDNSPVWTRTDDSVNLVAKANQHTTAPTIFTPEKDDFAMSAHGGTLPFYKDIDIVNMRVDNEEIIDRLSTNPNGFNWSSKKDNIDVNIMTYYPGHYIKREQKDGWEYIQLSMWGFDGAMYVEPYYRGTFEAVEGSYDEKTILRSYAGVLPTTDTGNKTKTIAHFRECARNNEMSLGDWRDFDFLCLYLIKYANYNSQSQVGSGIVNDSTKRATGYSYDGTNTFYAHDTLKGRDGYIGTNQKTTVWCLGLCNPWGNVGEFVDGITINYTNNNHVACVATNPAQYTNSAKSNTAGYINLGYTNWGSNGYPRRLGCDSNNPLIAFPDTNNSGTDDASTGICDYYFQYSSSDPRVVLRGGTYTYTTRAGAFYFDCYYVFSHSNGNIGCRLLKTA